MRFAERNAALGEVIGEVRRREHSGFGRLSHALAVETERAYHGRECAERRRELGRVVQRHPLLLEIRVVRKRQTLDRGEDGDEIP